jgi:hypothetical protein
MMQQNKQDLVLNLDLHLNNIANQHTTQFMFAKKNSNRVLRPRMLHSTQLKHKVMHTHISNTLIEKFLLPLNKAVKDLNGQCKKWAITDLPPLKESRPEIP